MISGDWKMSGCVDEDCDPWDVWRVHQRHVLSSLLLSSPFLSVYLRLYEWSSSSSSSSFPINWVLFEEMRCVREFTVVLGAEENTKGKHDITASATNQFVRYITLACISHILYVYFALYVVDWLSPLVALHSRLGNSTTENWWARYAYKHVHPYIHHADESQNVNVNAGKYIWMVARKYIILHLILHNYILCIIARVHCIVGRHIVYGKQHITIIINIIIVIIITSHFAQRTQAGEQFLSSCVYVNFNSELCLLIPRSGSQVEFSISADDDELH